MEDIKTTEFITESEAAAYKDMLKRCIESYANKDAGISDKEWLKATLVHEIAGISERAAAEKTESILDTVGSIAGSLKEMAQLAKEGKSKEAWLAGKIMESIQPDQMQEQGQNLSALEGALYEKNMQLSQYMNGAAQNGAVIDADYVEVGADSETEG